MSKSCQTCKSLRVISVYAHCSDMFGANAEQEYSGYVLEDLGIGSGDDVEFNYCMNCGQMQGKFPRPLSSIESKNSECEVCGQFTVIKKVCQYCMCIQEDPID